MIRVGARRSPLAVAQAEWIADRLARAGLEIEIVGIDSLGDVDRRRLTDIGGTGIFATAVREHLLAGTIDVAVHSLKDLPVDPAPGLVVAAIPEREDVRDVLVGLDVDRWRDGTIVGTGSPRRAVQLEQLARRRGARIEVVPIRGNVDTRLQLVRDLEVDATLLAAAGLLRLGRIEPGTITTGVDEEQRVSLAGLPARLLPVCEMLPAAGQGALAVECREQSGDELAAALATIEHAPTRACVEAERSFLKTLEAGCLAPVGALARADGADLTLVAVAGKKSQGDRGREAAGLLDARRTGAVAGARDLGAALAREVLPQLDETMEAE